MRRIVQLDSIENHWRCEVCFRMVHVSKLDAVALRGTIKHADDDSELCEAGKLGDRCGG